MSKTANLGKKTQGILGVEKVRIIRIRIMSYEAAYLYSFSAIQDYHLY
jgi:hypothetical protein